MISVKNLSKIYPPSKTALNDISFEVNKGEICGYVGSNGAGKSTTVKILCGALEFDSGDVFISGHDVKTESLNIKKITGYVPETSNLFNSLSAFEFIEFTGKIRNLENPVIKKRAEYFSEIFDYNGMLNQPLGNLSKGNKQKVLITSAFLHNPDIILLDEPLSGLDANSIFIFQDMIKELSEKGKTILYCSHILDAVEKISTKIILIENGCITIDKSIEELRKSKDYENLEKLFKNLTVNKETKKFCYEDIFE